MKSWLKSNPFVSILCICLVVMFVTGLVVSNTLTDNGNYLVKETRIQKDGYTLAGTLFIPKAALEKDGDVTAAKNGNNVNKVPAVITLGGGTANRYFQQNHVVELVKRGFVVFAIDAYNHGESDDFSGWKVYSHIHDALEYVHSLNYVDDAQVGFFGHSQGGSATMQALKNYAGYYTLEDEILNMLHDELGVEVTREQVEAQDPDAVAQVLDEHDLGYYEARKQEIIDSYNDMRVSFGVMEGMANGSAPPIGSGETNDVTPTVVEVAGVPVFRDIQANIATSMSLTDETVGVNAIGFMGLDGADELPSAESIRALYGTGEDAVELGMLYSVNMSSTEEQLLSTALGEFNADTWAGEEAAQAAADKSLRLMVMYRGWHNTSHYSQLDISTVASFMTLSTGFNNGYVAETGGSGAIGFDDVGTWKVTTAGNAVAFFALIIFALSFLCAVIKTPTFAAADRAVVEAPASRKSPMAWISMIFFVVLPVVLMPVIMNNSPIKSSWITRFEEINAIVFWALCCAVILLALIILKWNLYDKKRVSISFRDFYGLNCNVKSVLFMLLAVFFTAVTVIVVINIYSQTFSSANFMIAMPYLNVPMMFTPVSAGRYLDWICLFITFIPYWIIGGMLVCSARMKDMPNWLNTIILTIINFIPVAIFVYVQHFGYNGNGGTQPVLGINWGVLINMSSLVLVIPVSVVMSRVIYKRTGSSLPGAIFNAMLFTLPYLCTCHSCATF